MKKTFLLALIFGIPFFAAAQDNDDYELKGTEKFGYIIDKKGKRINGLVKLAGDSSTPWQNQKKVKFISENDIDNTKKRQKFKTLDEDDIQEYLAYDGDTKRTFQTVKYTNVKEGVSSNMGAFSAGIKAFNNLTKNNQLAELISGGKLKVYRIYGYPTTMAAGNRQVQLMEEEIVRLRNNPTYIYSKSSGKLKDLNYDDIRSLVSDCATVKDKIIKNEYGSIKADEGKKRTGLGKFVKDQIVNSTNDIVSAVNEVVLDYNQNCK